MPSNNAIFNIYYVFTPFVKLSGYRFLYFFSLFDVKNEVVFLELELFSPRGVKQKNMRKNLIFWPLNPYYKISDWKTWLAESFPETPTSKLQNKRKYLLLKLAEMEQNWIMFTPYCFIKNLWQIHLHNSHVKFTEKNKVDNATWAKSPALIGQKWQNSFW